MQINSAVLTHTLSPILITIDSDIRPEQHLPNVVITGVPPVHARETVSRIQTAARASNLTPPPQHAVLTVRSVAGSFRPQTLVGLDLAFALGYLGVFVPQGVSVFGELSLGGDLRHIRGALPLAMAARDAGAHTVIVPAGSATEVALTPDIRIIAARTLRDVVDYLLGKEHGCVEVEHTLTTSLPSPKYYDMADVQGQGPAIRALTMAAMLRKNILLIGPPGCGKSLLAARCPGILPPLSPHDARCVASNISAAGLSEPFVAPSVKRPFRAPHHSVSVQSLQGEVKLAEFGVLFYDDLPEFSRHTLGGAKPSAINWVVASANPCFCALSQCICSDVDRERYAQRVADNLKAISSDWFFCRLAPMRRHNPDKVSLGPTSESLREKVAGGWFHAGPVLTKALAWMDGDIQKQDDVRYAREAQDLRRFPF